MKPKSKPKAKPKPSPKIIHAFPVNNVVHGLDNRGRLWQLNYVPTLHDDEVNGRKDGGWIWYAYPALPK